MSLTYLKWVLLTPETIIVPGNYNIKKSSLNQKEHFQWKYQKKYSHQIATSFHNKIGDACFPYIIWELFVCFQKHPHRTLRRSMVLRQCNR